MIVFSGTPTKDNGQEETLNFYKSKSKPFKQLKTV